MAQPVRLASNFVVLDDKFSADVVPVTPELYQHIDEEYKDFAGHLLISSYTQPQKHEKTHVKGSDYNFL